MAVSDPAEDRWRPAPRRLLILGSLYGAIVLLIGSDVVADYLSGAGKPHIAFEGIVLVLAVTGIAMLSRELRAARARAVALRHDLLAARADAERWRAESRDIVRGLGQAIDKQFEEWGLTAAEREVGMLLVKGLSLKEIGEVRSTSERTARQQALAIYHKAGVAGRAELSAFFLEDLLPPSTSK